MVYFPPPQKKKKKIIKDYFTPIMLVLNIFVVDNKLEDNHEILFSFVKELCNLYQYSTFVCVLLRHLRILQVLMG